MFDKAQTEKVFEDMQVGVFPAKADSKTGQPSVIVTLAGGDRYFINRKEIIREVNGVEQPPVWKWRIGDKMQAQSAPPQEATA